MDLCIECKRVVTGRHRVVTGRQQALECDHYHESQHRICGTGISQQEYRGAVRSREELDWICGVHIDYYAVIAHVLHLREHQVKTITSDFEAAV